MLENLTLTKLLLKYLKTCEITTFLNKETFVLKLHCTRLNTFNVCIYFYVDRFCTQLKLNNILLPYG